MDRGDDTSMISPFCVNDLSSSLSQSFITFMDGLRLRMRAKDQLHPMLQELVTGYARFKGSKDWEGRSRMVSWFVPQMTIEQPILILDVPGLSH